MKILCITGSSEKSILKTARTLEAGGVLPAFGNVKHSLRFSEWHDLALSVIPNPHVDSAKPVALPRSLKTQAAEIISCNKSENTWFWAEKKSVRFLDFWKRLEPAVQFILVHTPPYLLLLEAIRDGAATKKDLLKTIEDWVSYSNAMLKFYRRNKDICSIVSSEDLSALKLISKKLDFSINLKNEEKKSKTETPLDNYLLSQLLKEHRTALLLNKEISDLAIITTEVLEHDKTYGFDSAFEFYLASNNPKLANNQDTQTTSIKKYIAKDNIEPVENKNKADIIFKSTSAESSAYDVSELISQLHLAQEAQEKFLIRSKNSDQLMIAQQMRAERLLKLNPNYWDMESVEVSHSHLENGNSVYQWSIKNVYIGPTLVPEIRLKTQLDSNIAGIIIERTEYKEWIKWPEIYSNSENLPCIPVNGSISSGNNAILSSFGTTDWKNLCELVKHMTNALDQPIDDRYVISIDRAPLKKGLSALSKVLSEWPTILRFDEVKLSDTFQINDYQRVGMTLTNLSLGQYFWPSIEYRIATVDPTAKFGENPRLEFLESSNVVFENWTAEHDEIRGARLELRFAEPAALDTDIWNQFSQKDKILVVGIINTLPSQMTRLQKDHPTDLSNWENWIELGARIKAILQKYYILQRPDGQTSP
ncbi:hypothetical protein [Pseudomonas alabamensis]|uniref:hypothetical protein n=1 Tax=Pseudomonas alabamensis TaxID=3064349 RepID=UPI0021DA6CE9|nr:hypothetical protein [Pseudomonas entomophila]